MTSEAAVGVGTPVFAALVALLLAPGLAIPPLAAELEEPEFRAAALEDPDPPAEAAAVEVAAAGADAEAFVLVEEPELFAGGSIVLPGIVADDALCEPPPDAVEPAGGDAAAPPLPPEPPPDAAELAGGT
jgi:hypothetical protein